MSKLMRPTVKNRKMVSKEGIDKATGNDYWLLDELRIDQQANSDVVLEIQTIRLDTYLTKGMCKQCGEARYINSHKLCEVCNGEDMNVLNEGEV